MKLFSSLIIIMLLLFGSLPLYAQGTRPEVKPFVMPVAGESSPSTWILGQVYGNTTGAFVSGANQYSAGQFLHFGIDISMPCGTPVVAVADGIVDSVDNPYRGSAPHNLLLRFPDLGIVVLYGHLLERSTLIAGQPVKQGEVVGLSGEPEGNCEGRTHLHFEVRSLDQTIAYNPIHYINAPWHSLSGLDSRFRPLFQRDLTNPRQWMSLEDQPDVQFGGRRLNNYTETWPAGRNRRLPAMTQPDRPVTSISRNWGLLQVGMDGCCAGAWWHPTDSNRIYFMDGVSGQTASIFEFLLDWSQAPTPIRSAPPAVTSADGAFELVYESDKTIIRQVADGTEWHLPVTNVTPTLSPNNAHVMWVQGDTFRDVWVSAMDGSTSEVVWRGTDRETTARWLDNDRLLITEQEGGRYSTLSVVNIHDKTSYPLGTWYNVRNLQIAPGGKWLILMNTFEPDPSKNGLYAVDTLAKVPPQKLNWFADYRWRDAESLFYLTFDPTTDLQQLHYYHVPTGESFPLTDEAAFTIANGDWAVSPDGNAIIFQDARDDNMWLLRAEQAPS